MGLTSVLLKDPILFLALAVPMLYSVIMHEIAHGAVAYLFGDDTAKRMGRLTLNPKANLDLVGTVALFIVGFGWAKPVPVNYYKLKNYRLGMICVSFAGCFTNILIAAISIYLLKVLKLNPDSYIAIALLVLAKINILLGAFNLIPFPPLDGSKVLLGFMPIGVRQSVERYEQFGFIILFFLLLSGLLNPLINLIQNIILQFIGMLL